MDKRRAKAVLKNLRKARALIEAGWIKGMLRATKNNKDGTKQTSYCMIGAIHKADGSGEGAALDLIGNLALEMYPKRNTDQFNTQQSKIFMFNDHKDTRKPQVLRVIDRGIKQMEDILNGNA